MNRRQGTQNADLNVTAYGKYVVSHPISEKSNIINEFLILLLLVRESVSSCVVFEHDGENRIVYENRLIFDTASGEKFTRVIVYCTACLVYKWLISGACVSLQYTVLCMKVAQLKGPRPFTRGRYIYIYIYRTDRNYSLRRGEF